MNIGVNTRLLIGNRLEGIGQFTNETLKRITVQHPEHRFYFFFDRPPSPEFLYSENVIPVVVRPQARHPVLWWLYFEVGIPQALKKYNIDLFLSPDGWLSLSTDIRSVSVIHDLNFEYHPEQIKWMARRYYLKYFPLFAKKAYRIATVSEFSKSNIVDKYGIDPKSIDVVYNGVKEIFRPGTEEENNLTRKKYNNSQPYFVFVGLIHERKNLSGLFQAFDIFKEKNSEYKLLIVGEKKWWSGKIENTYLQMQHKYDVVFLGRLGDEDLASVMRAAKALCYVPFFEGFGIPILEGMKSGIPVITSSCSSMPEVGGNAVLLADPNDPGNVAEAMLKVANDNHLCDELITKGFARAADFSWDKTATLLWNCLKASMD